MEPNSRYNLVGGITAVVLYPTSAPLPEQPTTVVEDGSEALEVSLEIGGASYVEVLTPQSATGGTMNYFVKHSLKLKCCHDSAPFTPQQLFKLLNDGVIADILLATGATIRVGWSERYGAEYPLRLISTTFDSGSKPLDYPVKDWLFESIDQSILI